MSKTCVVLFSKMTSFLQTSCSESEVEIILLRQVSGLIDSYKTPPQTFSLCKFHHFVLYLWHFWNTLQIMRGIYSGEMLFHKQKWWLLSLINCCHGNKGIFRSTGRVSNYFTLMFKKWVGYYHYLQTRAW